MSSRSKDKSETFQLLGTLAALIENHSSQIQSLTNLIDDLNSEIRGLNNEIAEINSTHDFIERNQRSAP